ncbi:uncharacterized protein LOC132556421 [Ylistrum balloti]|uniref:uncharacterized protein LOC132556421 n=1 Tax=Ylistrum balloti TaxID=509963 RepID=UPI002905E509|nr:uncharacterized protein LOC132556421 [Ylistrum balloti]
MANTDDSTCENIQDFVLAKTGESHQEPQVMQSLWTEVRKTRDVGVQCDQSQIERKETCKLERGKDESSVDKNGIDRENISCVEVERPQKSLVAPKQDHFPAISGKLKIASKETEDANELQKSELEMEILVLKNRLEQAEKEKTEIQEKHDEAFLKIVSDNKKMNESLIEIHEHVRREKIDSERTKVEVEMVLQQRQKLIDEVKNLTKGFEMMISERKRMENVIETSISAFDCKIYVKDEEIRILQETIDNDRKQFLEERDEYLTEIQSLKSELVSRDHGEEKNAR